MKRFWMLLLALMCIAAAGCAQEEALAARASALREAVMAPPYGISALSETGFSPVPMRVEDFDPDDLAWMRSIGIGEEGLADTHVVAEWTQRAQGGEEITAIFCGWEGELVFVFEKTAAGEERLTDVLFGANAYLGSPRLVEMAGGRYLLTTAWGHGTGTYRLWTNWYNLDTRTYDLCLLREGYEGEGELSVHVVTHTSADDPQDMSLDSWDENLLTTYAYTTVSRTQAGHSVVLDDDCTVNLYESRDGGLLRRGTRVFDAYTAALLEQANPDELLDPAWGMETAGEELLDTAQTAAAQMDTRALGEAVAPALKTARIVNAPWVNLRQEGRKDSPAIAEVTDAETVYILAEKQGFENGWTKVLYLPKEDAPDKAPKIGYIWWSFLSESK